MNIQPVGSPVTTKLEERQVAPADKRAATASGVQPSREELGAAVKKINESMPGSAQSLEFQIDDESKEIVVRVIDRNTMEVVRQMPSKEALEIAKAIDKMQGRLLHQTA